jgi:hypothetical protein
MIRLWEFPRALANAWTAELEALRGRVEGDA